MKTRLLALLALAAATATLAHPAAAATKATAPVIVQKDSRFGRVLFTRAHQALYYWTVEKKAGGKIRCVGSCAKAWPPLIVKSAAAVPSKLAGVRGTFGVVKRPDGRLQATYNRLPLYGYAHEGPNQILCNNVDGWFVVRV